MGRELYNYGCMDLWFTKVTCAKFVSDYKLSISKPTNFNLESYYKGTLLLDDFGFEKKAFNQTELIGDVIFERDRNRVRTFITTNLSPTEVYDRYGNVVSDRINGYNIIRWTGTSFRQ